MLERAEKEYYSESGITEQTVNELNVMCADKLKRVPSLHMNVEQEVRKYEDVIRNVEGTEFMKNIMREIYVMLKQNDLTIDDARKFMLKLGMCARMYFNDTPEVIFLYSYCVLRGIVKGVDARMFIDEIINDHNKSMEIVARLNEIKFDAKDIMKITVLCAIIILIICVIIRVVQIRRKVQELKNNIKGMKEAYEQMRIQKNLIIIDDINKELGRKRVQEGFFVNEDA